MPGRHEIMFLMCVGWNVPRLLKGLLPSLTLIPRPPSFWAIEAARYAIKLSEPTGLGRILRRCGWWIGFFVAWASTNVSCT